MTFTFDPAISPPVLPRSDVSYAACDTAVGRLLLAEADGRLVLCAYAADPAREDILLERLARTISPRVLRAPRPLDDARRQVEEFLAGDRRRFELATDLVLATGFQREVLHGLDAVGYGARTTYGELAGRIGRAGAARAVGAALGANPLCLVLPCHRVVPAAGGVGGYAGGAAVKELLLALESAA